MYIEINLLITLLFSDNFKDPLSQLLLFGKSKYLVKSSRTIPLQVTVL